MEYLQQLQDKVLEEEAALLEGAKGSQVMGSKHKEVAVVKMGGSNPCERCVCTRQDCLVHPSRWVINNFLLYSCSLAYAGYITLKQRCVPHTPTITLAIIPTYGGVLSVIEKALQELVEEYWGVGKFLQGLVEGQERNMAQLERIRAMMEQR